MKFMKQAFDEFKIFHMKCYHMTVFRVILSPLKLELFQLKT